MVLVCFLLESRISRNSFVCHTMCPRSSDPFYIVFVLYKTGHNFLDIQHDYKQVLRVFDMHWMASTNTSEIEGSLFQFSILPLKLNFYSPVRVLSPSLCVRPLIFSIFSIISLAWQEKKEIYLKFSLQKKTENIIYILQAHGCGFGC